MQLRDQNFSFSLPLGKEKKKKKKMFIYFPAKEEGELSPTLR